MKKLNKSGALRARTRAFLCAITLMLAPATAFAGLSGDAIVGNTISRAGSYLPAATPSEELVGGVYHYTVDISSWQSLYKEGALDSEHSGETYKCHIEYFLSEQVPVGQWVRLTTVNTTHNANTILQSTGEGTGTWFKRDAADATSGNWYITSCLTGSRVYGLFVYHIADNEWFYCINGLQNSNTVLVAINIGEVPVYNVSFDVNNTEMGTIRSAASLPDIRTGIRFDDKCSGRAMPNSGYKFGIWSDGSTYQTHNFPTYCTATYTAYFVPSAAVSRTVTVNNGTGGTGAVLWNNEAEGPVLAQSSGSFFEGVPVNLVATQTGSDPFHHWEDENGDVVAVESTVINGNVTTCVVIVPSKNTTYTPIFAPAAPVTPTYTVAATVSPAGAGTVTGDGTYDEGENVTLTATPANRHYRFLRWTESASEVATTASYTINSINAAHTLVAEFEEIPVTLDDNGTSDYYTATLSTFNTETDFQLMRTFYAGMWNTVCFPFALSSSQIAASDMSGATFYTLTSVTGDAAEGLDFNVSEVTSLSARTPYLVQVTGSNIVNPVFEGVTLDANAFTNNTSGTNVGDTKFFGTVHPTALEIGQGSGFLFLGQNNNLYWPNVNNDIRAFRAYFYSGNNAVQAIHPRVRIVLQNETTTGIEETGVSGVSGESGKSGLSGVSVKKYLRNGSLVIEKNGVKYNAVGQEIK